MSETTGTLKHALELHVDALVREIQEAEKHPPVPEYMCTELGKAVMALLKIEGEPDL